MRYTIHTIKMDCANKYEGHWNLAWYAPKWRATQRVEVYSAT
jgi:hypothetical protein